MQISAAECNVENVVVQPKSFKTNLYPHQLNGISLMEVHEHNKHIELDEHQSNQYGYSGTHMNIDTNIGIFGDITGYGKTAAVIGLLVRDRMEWDTTEQYIHKSYIMHYGDGRILATGNMKYDKIDCNLILVSQTLIKQWENELAATNLRYMVVGTKKHIMSCDPDQYDVIIVSPSMYNAFVSHQNGRSQYPYAWKRFIFDEPQCTNISAMKNIMAGFNWFITATPHMMLNKSRNRNSFITNMFHFGVHRSIFDALIIKNDDNYVKQSYELPETKHHYYETYQPLCNIVRGIASESVTKMLEADNIAGAIKLLGGSTNGITHSNIFELLRNIKHDELKEIELKIARYRQRADSVKEAKWVAKELQINKQLQSLEQRLKDISKKSCVICTEEVCTKPVMISGCCHIFCGSCILQWLKTKPSCPVCRNNTNANELIYIETSDEKSENSETKSLHDHSKLLTKQQTVIDIIKKNISGKFIIFSGFEETFINIRTCLEQENITFGEISGKKEARENVIENFKNGNMNVLFLNSINSGDGLNLQEATDIILYHNMATGIETQILGRANRIGRKNNLSVHHLN